MRRDNHVFRRVVASHNLPTRYPVGWVLVFYLFSERMDIALIWWLFWLFFIIHALIYTVRVWQEIHIEVIDPKLNELPKNDKSNIN